MRNRIAYALSAAAVLFGAAQSARANIAAPQAEPTEFGGPVARPSPLAVDDEYLEFRCREQSGEPVCEVAARYNVTNPTDAAVQGIGSFYGVRMRELRVTKDGQLASVPFDAATQSKLDATMSGMLDETLDPPGPNLSRAGFQISVPSRAKAELAVTGLMLSELPYFSREEHSPAAGRHPFLHFGNAELTEHRFKYLLSPLRTWSGAHRVHLRVVTPKDWDIALELKPHSAHDEHTLKPPAGKNDWSLELSADRTSTVELIVKRPASSVEHGGPMLAIGTVLGSNAASGLRLRAGWEIAAPSYLVHSITGDIGRADSDFGDRVTFALQTEAATKHILFFPSLSVGAGLAMEVAPEAALGARFLGSVQFYSVGLVLSLDFFPSHASDEGRTQFALLGRVSL